MLPHMLAAFFALTVTVTLFAAEPALEPIRVSDDAKGFVGARTGKPFTPWGFNYGCFEKLVEEMWDAGEWAVIEKDFADMKALGCNVVRLHLQFDRFMVDAKTPNEKALANLTRMLAIAEKAGMYFDVTGLSAYRTKNVPAWYDALSESDRWAAQAVFWEAVARTCRDSTAVFCYDLMNEPIASGNKRKPGEWYSGKPLGGFDFVQFISIDPAGRNRGEIARDWIRTLKAAVRKHDKTHPITVGLLPPWRKGVHWSGFDLKLVGPELDFICVHLYPKSGKVDEELEFLSEYAVGKPVVIEETFNMSCTIAELEDFLRRSRPTASGWVGHYFGKSLSDLEALQKTRPLTYPEAAVQQFMTLFKKLGPPMKAGK
jgi:hypothetical protein